MLTITTNKTEIKGIADRTITEKNLPITDFWTKRIINLLGFSDSGRKTIMYNLAEGRPGTGSFRPYCVQSVPRSRARSIMSQSRSASVHTR